jgi:SWI/SNF-related matrix-associated actin-dependent regulator 1 of chromatin subfamily A
MNDELFPYQVEGAEWLARKKLALLADEMGLGKSAQAITAADHLAINPILVICPAVAVVNWTREFKKFSKYEREVFIVRTSRDVPPSTADLVVCSYDLAVRLHKNGTWSKMLFHLVVLDESHFLKNVEAQRTKAIFSKTGIVRRATRVWCLTGTPMPAHPGELWVMLRTFGRTKLSFYDFVQHYCEMAPGWRSGDPIQISGAKHEAIPALKQLLAPIMLRRRKEDVLKQLPPIHFGEVIVEPGNVPLEETAHFFEYVYPNNRVDVLNKKLFQEHELLKLNLRAMADANRYQGHTEAVGATIKMLEALAGSVSTLRRFNGLQKVEPVAEMIAEELEQGAYDKVVLFCVHRDVIELLRRRLRRFGAVTLYGGLNACAKQRNVDKFQHSPKCRVFIGNILAAGTAITLTASNQVVFVEQEWTPGHNAQAAMRCHRIGQDRPVTVRFVTIVDSIDEKITGILRRKTRDIAAIFNNGKIEHTMNERGEPYRK